MVMGRLRAASPQSPSPPGCNETDPSTMLIRATRVGGSLSSSARACGGTKSKRPATQSKSPNLLPLLHVIVFMTNPLFSERSEEHTSELQSRFDIVCSLLL